MSGVSNTAKLSIDLMRTQISRGRILTTTFLMAFGAILDVAGVSIIFIVAKIVMDVDGSVQKFPWILSFTAEKNVIFFCIVFAFLFYVVKFVISITNSFVASKVCFGVYEGVSRKLLDSYMRQPYEFHIGRNSSELTHNVHSVSLAIALTVILPALTLFSEIFVIITFLCVFFWEAPILTAIGLGIIGGLGWIFVGITKPLFTARGRAAYRAGQDLTKLIAHTFGSIKEVKIYAAEQFFENEHNVIAHRFSKLDGFHVVSQKFVQPVMELVVANVLIIGIAILGGVGKGGDQYTPIILVAAMSALRLLPSLVRLANSVQSMQFDSAAARHLFEDMSLPKEISARASRRSRFSQIELKDVTYAYPSAVSQVLNGVNLTIRRGDAIAIVGSSGSGKTTLTDVLLGLLRPASGEVLIDGRPGRAYQELSVAYVPQQVYLIDASLRSNIAFGVDPSHVDEARLMRAIEQAHLSALIERLPEGLDMVCGERGVRLSGGERQRISIARALYADPDLIVMDEATSALDADTEAFITATIAELRGEQRTIIIVTHREGVIQGCNRLVSMASGQVVSENNL